MASGGLIIIGQLNFQWIYWKINETMEIAISKIHHYSTTVRVKRNRGRRRRMKTSPKRKGKVLTCQAVMVYAATAKRSSMATFDTDSGEVGIDNRASGCFSHVITDFIGPMRDCNRVVKGFGGSRTSNVKMGTLKWSWEDDKGIKTTHLIPNSYYSQVGGVRLLSPQHFAQELGKKGAVAGSRTSAKDIALHWGTDEVKTVPLDRRNNVATFHLSPGYEAFNAYCMQSEADEDTGPKGSAWDDEESDNRDIVHAVKRERDWMPYRPIAYDTEGRRLDQMSHMESKRMNLEGEMLQLHCNMGHIHPDRLKLMARQGIIFPKFQHVRMPFCAACAYGKAIRKPWRSRTSNNRDEASVKSAPGETVSVDQMISPTPGLVAQMTGMLTNKRYMCATIYVDQYSGYSFIWLQKSTGAEETLMGKRAFEAHARESGVRIKHYHADNGVFKARSWVAECERIGQRMTYAGVGAHHQNGVAERRIRVLQDLTRAQMAHASHRWPEAISANLWPYALRIANDEWNMAPGLRGRQGRSPAQIFHSTPVNRNLKHSIPFGSPVYVLKDALQQRMPFHKWRDRARLGMYLGRSPVHSRSVSLVMDLQKGYVSPQFHCAHDRAFDTIKGTKDSNHGMWKARAGFVRRGRRKSEIEDPQNRLRVSGRGEIEKTVFDPKCTESATGDTVTNEDPNDPTQDGEKDIVETTDTAMETRIDVSEGAHEGHELLAMYAEEQSLEVEDLVALKAQADPDTMYFHQAMREPDADKFIQAMDKEIQDQCLNGNFEVIPKKDMPKGVKPLPAVWQMRRKRDIRSGDIKKYKARLNLDGSKMVKGVDYDKTYAPVATWNAIRILLIMVLSFRWHTIQIDYVAAFPQAPIERTLFMNIPAGVSLEGKDSKEYVLKCNKNIYGQRQAGRVWNEYLVGKLKKIGFQQSSIDECVLYRGRTIYVLYTDDSIIAGPDRKELEDTIESIKKIGLDITIEGDLEDFLGIRMDRKSDGTIHMSQPHLIRQILNDLKMDPTKLNAKPTPMVSSTILKRHQDSPAHDGSFHYRSVVGKMNYLEKGSRPDISYAVHQCARFSASPRVEHSKAIRRIARYLAGTMDRGMVFRPDKLKGLMVHVDADFAGNWDSIDSSNVDTARSRHGYVISLAGCPICWKSQLQSEIALSSTESEYTGLSYALREAIPIINLLQEMQRRGVSVNSTTPQIKCTVFEDNSGALEMAREHKYRPRTKHLNIKLHHFRWHVNQGIVEIAKISTTDQCADVLTKPLPEESFVRHREFIMGW